MPWRPLPRIAFAIATHPFQPSASADLPLELGDELYIIEEGGKDWSWYRGYLVAPPSLLAGLTSVKGQTLEARVFSGIFPRSCVEVREFLGAGGRETQGNGASGASQKILENRGTASIKQKDGPIVDSDTLEQPILPRSTYNGDGGLRENDTDSFKATSGLPQSLTPIQLRDDANVPRPPAPVPMLKIGDETPTSKSEPLVDEIASCLREWYATNLHELLLSRDYDTLDKLTRLVNLLDTSRRQLLHGVLTTAELETLREKTVWDLVNGNIMLGNEIIVRDTRQRGCLLTGADSPIEIAKLQATMSLLDSPPATVMDNVNLHHLLLELKDVSNSVSDGCLLVANLSVKRGTEPLTPITESFSMEVSSRDSILGANSSGKLRTLFPSLTSTDIGTIQGSDTSLYLVIRVIANDEILEDELESTRPPTSRSSGTSRKDSVAGPSTPSAKGGRRSLMWGATKSQRQRTPNTARSEDVSEFSRDVSSPPHTRSSSRPRTRSKDPNDLKRLIGVAVLPLDDFLAATRETEQELTIWSPSNSSGQIREHQDTNHKTVQEILLSHTGGIAQSNALSSIRVRLSSFVNPDAEKLIRLTPTLLHNVPCTLKMGFSGAPTKPRSDIYITLTEPKLVSGALFSHPERGYSQLDSGLNMQNLQLTLEVRKSNGERIEKCIFPAANATGSTAWRTVAIRRGQKWNQTFKLSIPVEDVPTAHVIMSIANAPDFPFALSWMPLWANGAFLRDGAHYPLLHLYDKSTSTTDANGRGAYLGLPWDSKGKESFKFESVAGPVACLKMQSFLCSTVFTQDPVLLGILRWKDQMDSELIVLLRQLVFVPEIEIVKLVSEVLDALFAILVEHSGNDEVEDLVFTALVTVLGIVHDRRFKLGPLVHEYAEMRFNFPFATPCLISSLLRLIMRPADYQNSRQLRATFKVGQQIIRFILIARKQQMVKEASIGVLNTQPTFNRDFQQIFVALESQMREDSALAVGSKTLLVQHVHTWLPELRLCFSEEDSMDITISFIDACDHVQGKLILHKLVMIWNILKDAITLSPNVTQRLTSKLHGWLRIYWGRVSEVTEQYREQVRLCCSILSLLDSRYGPDTVDYYVEMLESYACIEKSPRNEVSSTSLLFQSSYPFQVKQGHKVPGFDESLTELAALKSTISASDLVRYIDMNRPDLVDLVILALDVDMSIISNVAFPSSWLTLNVYQHRAIFDMLEGFSKLLCQIFIPQPEEADEFNTEVWRRFLLSTLKLVRSDTLALETFPEQKRRAVWKIGGDIREKGAELLSRLWDSLGWDLDPEEQELYGLSHLGGYQVQYVPSLVSPIVDLCLSVHGGLRRVAVEIMQSMIISEWSLNEDLTIIQAEMVVCLDNIFKSKSVGDNAQQRLFIEELTDAFRHLENTADQELWTAIQRLVLSLDELLDLLVAAHAPDQDEAHRIMHTLQLMNFLRDMHKEELYVSYVHQLATVEADARNFKEAGLALRLHADLYSWDSTDLLPELTNPVFPKQSSFERKESIYFDMIQNFEEGGAWESALVCYSELANHYEKTVFDFAKLARTQKSTARIYEMIARGETNTPRYFRVIYRGLGFPESLRDKHFVCEAGASERLVHFTDRLFEQHPNARLLRHGEAGDLEGQHLHVTVMTLHRDLEDPMYQRQKIPHSTKEFLSSLRAQKFSVTSVTTRSHESKPEAKDQWVEKTVFTTSDVFPTILRRSEIVAEETISLSPLETALERTLRKSHDLGILNRRVSNGDDASIFKLTESVRSCVDPSSTTGVAQYRDLLPLATNSPTYPTSPPQMKPLELALQTALIDFASTLKHGLSLCMKPGNELEHRTLALQFAATFAPELAVIAPNHTVSPLYSPGPRQIMSPIPTISRPQTNGTAAHAAPADTQEVVGSQTTKELGDARAPRDRFSSMIKRTTAMAPLTMTMSPAYTNGNLSTSQPTTNQDERPAPASAPRSTSQSKRGNSYSARESQDDAYSRDEKRPITAHSTVTSKSGQSKKKTGSIRKRLSTLGLGKKPSRATVIHRPELVEEE